MSYNDAHSQVHATTSSKKQPNKQLQREMVSKQQDREIS